MTSQAKSQTLLSAWGLDMEAPVHIPPATGRIPKAKKEPIMASKSKTKKPLAKDSLNETPSLASAPTSAGRSPPPTPTPSEAPAEMQGFKTPPHAYRGMLSPQSIQPSQASQISDLDCAEKDNNAIEVDGDDDKKTPTATNPVDEAKSLFRELAKTDAQDPSQAKLRPGDIEQSLEPK